MDLVGRRNNINLGSKIIAAWLRFDNWMKGDDIWDGKHGNYTQKGGYRFYAKDGQSDGMGNKGLENHGYVNLDEILGITGRYGGSGGPGSLNSFLEKLQNLSDYVTSMADAGENISTGKIERAILSDTLIFINNHGYENIDKDSFKKFFRHATFDSNGLYNSDNVYERK